MQAGCCSPCWAREQRRKNMLHLLSWETTLPIQLIGMLGIFLVIGVIVLAVTLLG